MKPNSSNPRIVAAAGTAVFLPDGRLLLARHHHDGAWATIGGRVETDETREAAARREMAEEVGLDLPALQPLGEFGNSPIYTVNYPEWGPTTYQVTMFATVLASAEPIHPDRDEILETGWFTARQCAEQPLAADMAEIIPAAYTWFSQQQLD